MNPQEQALSLWPAAASAAATSADHLIWSFTALTLVLVVPIFAGIAWFAIRYRDGKPANRRLRHGHDRMIELGWMIIPFVLTLFFFVWGMRLFVDQKLPPANAMRIEAIGRQWMWKFEHPGGQAEINDLHVPAGQPVLINMISQDVIHGLYIPALRIQMETLPGRYTQLWFNADRVGTYRLLCSEFCGTDHSTMVGLLYVMTPADYAAWLAHSHHGERIVSAGRRLFASYGCAGCHQGGTVAAPALAGLYGQVAANGAYVDDTYLRNAILDPDSTRVAGQPAVMPPFKGVVSEDDLFRLIAYIKSLDPAAEASR